MVAHSASSATPDRRSHRRQREYQVLARWDTPKVGEGRELYALPDRGSG
ncbi:hypothetical protein [Escherichia coli]